MQTENENNTIWDSIKVFFITVIISVPIYFGITYLHNNFTTIAVGTVTSSVSLVGYIIYGIYMAIYYFFRLFRYLFIVASGVGYDLTKNYCTTNTFDIINGEYAKSSVKNMISYYDYCVESGLVSFAVFIMFFVMLFIVIVLVCVMIMLPYMISSSRNTKYENTIMERNRQYNDLTSTMTRYYYPLTKVQRSNIIVTISIVAHIILSIVSYIIRYYVGINEFMNPYLLGAYIGTMLIIGNLDTMIFVAMTPVVEMGRVGGDIELV